ncbi:MAG: hypothetical protein E7505_05545 [Ruminococcus sp.]|nr:hypothetical protein [Ruminococcus sp.]
MSESKNKRKSILLIIASTILLIFLGYNLYWYSFYSSFNRWVDSCNFGDGCKLISGMNYSQADKDAEAAYFLCVPSYLGKFGQIGISQWLKFNDDPKSEYLYIQDMDYAVLLRVNKTMFDSKTYWVDIKRIKGVKKGTIEEDYSIQVDSNMNIIDSESYSEVELKSFEECKETIDELYALLKSFYGEDNINDL